MAKNSVESMLAQGKARARQGCEPKGYASGGRVTRAAMEAYEGSAKDKKQDMAGARAMMKRGMARGGRMGGC